jgi:hypothetical protein
LRYSWSHHIRTNPYRVPEDLAIGLALATELGDPLLIPLAWPVEEILPQSLTQEERVLLAAALSFLEGLYGATRSSHSMQVYSVERWLRQHRVRLGELRVHLVTCQGAIQHSLDDAIKGRLTIDGQSFFWVFAEGVELWSWRPRETFRFRATTEGEEPCECCPY